VTRHRWIVLLAILALGAGLTACGPRATEPAQSGSDAPVTAAPALATGPFDNPDNATTPEEPQTLDSASPAATGGPPPSPAEAFVEGSDLFVPAQTVHDAVDQGMNIVFVDARTAMDYEFGHIPGAINVPYFEAEQHLDRLPRDAWIVAYCECPIAEARQVADTLIANGFTQVKVIEEGLQGWRELGGEVVGGTVEPTS
jgi:rhodanese-related sulfurtransferase